jgi:hypothetical protein
VFVVVMYVGGVSSKLPASARSEAIVRCGRAQNVSVWIPIDPVPAAASLAFVRASHASGTWYRRPPPRQPRVCRVLLIVMPSGEGVDVGRGPASVFCTKGGGGGHASFTAARRRYQPTTVRVRVKIMGLIIVITD